MNINRQQILVAVARELRLHDMQNRDMDSRASRLCTLFEGLYNIATEQPSQQEPRKPRWDPQLGDGQFEDPAERTLRVQAYRALEEAVTTEQGARKRLEAAQESRELFERLEAAADVLEQARGGGPQPGLVLRADAIQAGDGIVVPETGEVKWVVGAITDGNLSKAHIALATAQGLHVLYKTGDPDLPRHIMDGTGEVVLQMCRLCGAAEADLTEVVPCPGPPENLDYRGADAAGA